MANVDYYLKLKCKKAGEIKGEAKAKNHDGEIAVTSWSWGEVNSGSASSVSGPAAGAVSMQDIHFTAQMQKSSAAILLACATGDPVTEALLSCRKAGVDQQDFLKITLTDALISSYQTGGSGGEVIPQESFSINFAKIKMEYKVQQPDGTVTAGGDATFDLRTVASE